MARNVFFLLCVWTSISVFSETTFYWNQYDNIAGINFAEMNFPTIFINSENYWLETD